jgi:hypothetical protein
MQSLSQAELRKLGVMMENFTARFVAERRRVGKRFEDARDKIPLLNPKT